MTEQFEAVKFYNQLSAIQICIAKRLAYDEEIAKLLLFNEPDALSREITKEQMAGLLLQRESNAYRRIYLSPLPPQAQSIEVSQIRIHFSKVLINHRERIYKPKIVVDVACHNKLLPLADGINQRCLYLMQHTHDLLNGYNCGTVCSMQCSDINEWVMGNAMYVGYALIFDCGELRL